MSIFCPTISKYSRPIEIFLGAFPLVPSCPSHHPLEVEVVVVAGRLVSKLPYRLVQESCRLLQANLQQAESMAWWS